MKPCLLRPLAREDRRHEVRYHRDHAGTTVALRLVKSMAASLDQISRQPGLGSPVLGQQLDIAGLRTWLVGGFPLAFWYIERERHIDVVRLVGQRQDALSLTVDDEP